MALSVTRGAVASIGLTPEVTNTLYANPFTNYVLSCMSVPRTALKVEYRYEGNTGSFVARSTEASALDVTALYKATADTPPKFVFGTANVLAKNAFRIGRAVYAPGDSTFFTLYRPLTVFPSKISCVTLFGVFVDATGTPVAPVQTPGSDGIAPLLYKSFTDAQGAPAYSESAILSMLGVPSNDPNSPVSSSDGIIASAGGGDTEVYARLRSGVSGSAIRAKLSAISIPGVGAAPATWTVGFVDATNGVQLDAVAYEFIYKDPLTSALLTVKAQPADGLGLVVFASITDLDYAAYTAGQFDRVIGLGEMYAVYRAFDGSEVAGTTVPVSCGSRIDQDGLSVPCFVRFDDAARLQTVPNGAFGVPKVVTRALTYRFHVTVFPFTDTTSLLSTRAKLAYLGFDSFVYARTSGTVLQAPSRQTFCIQHANWFASRADFTQLEMHGLGYRLLQLYSLASSYKSDTLMMTGFYADSNSIFRPDANATLSPDLLPTVAAEVDYRPDTRLAYQVFLPTDAATALSMSVLTQIAQGMGLTGALEAFVNALHASYPGLLDTTSIGKWTPLPDSISEYLVTTGAVRCYCVVQATFNSDTVIQDIPIQLSFT
jgi:hypothetical protein